MQCYTLQQNWNIWFQKVSFNPRYWYVQNWTWHEQQWINLIVPVLWDLTVKDMAALFDSLHTGTQKCFDIAWNSHFTISIVCLPLQIPNPLFDLAGITCGHFLVDFWTFFGATLVGKAIVKMHIQVSFYKSSIPNCVFGLLGNIWYP